MLTQQLRHKRAVPVARAENLDLDMLTFKAFGRGAELTEHLGYEKHGDGKLAKGNARNGAWRRLDR